MPHLFRLTPPCNRYYAWFSALHTRVDLLLLAPLTEDEFQTVEEAIHAELTAVEQMGNRFDPNSELSRAVQAATARPVLISKELYSLLSRCLQANRETGGLFDITVNSPAFTPRLINASTPGLISAVELIPAAPSPPPSSLAAVPEVFPSGYLRLHEEGIILDLSGILKGYALERLRQLLASFAITDALISLGNSSILSLGHNPSDIPPGNCLTTSGNATPQRRHIRNPLTGKLIEGQKTISVTTPNGIDGEILSITRFLQRYS